MVGKIWSEGENGCQVLKQQEASLQQKDQHNSSELRRRGARSELIGERIGLVRFELVEYSHRGPARTGLSSQEALSLGEPPPLSLKVLSQPRVSSRYSPLCLKVLPQPSSCVEVLTTLFEGALATSSCVEALSTPLEGAVATSSCVKVLPTLFFGTRPIAAHALCCALSANRPVRWRS